MRKTHAPVELAVEEWLIPTYLSPEEDEMPMFAETRNHQLTSGNPYPSRIVSKVDREHRVERPYTVIRLENEYIRLAVIPELGGRVFEAYDKTTGYDFLYRQHVIKPALIGAYGSWISGGIEFNWPYHHRPSTLMPVDYTLEQEEDGTAIVWLSEHEPVDRTKGMVGIVLKPGTSYFETRVAVTNRTPHKHTFLWWENAAVAVHEDYRLIFPPDVTWVHHHYDAGHTTYPIASGQYGADNIETPKDISWHKNSRLATSYFAAPSKYDFFGGYDYRKDCGILHIANHHISPGKKMFTWGYGSNAENWEDKLTDADGPYAELMAGSYTDDQPDFTILAPYETKTFSQFWYPTQGIGYTNYANLDAAVALDRDASEIRLNVTSPHEEALLTIQGADGRLLLSESLTLTPSVVTTRPFAYPDNEKLTIRLITAQDTLLLHYTEEDADSIHIPKDTKGIPLPDALTTPCELVIAGKHIDQYRDPKYKPDLYYLEALQRDPHYLPALKALGEYYCRTFRYEEALLYLDRAYKIENVYNQNPEDGSVNYYRGLCHFHLGHLDTAYDLLYKAAWSQNVISQAMTLLAAIDGRRKDYGAMQQHAIHAMEKEWRHPLAIPYAALALWKSGEKRRASELIRHALDMDPLNQLARYVLCCITGKGKQAFYDSLFSNPAQTALDIGYDLMNAGFILESISLFKGILGMVKNHAMLRYTLGYCYELLGDPDNAARQRKLAGKDFIVDRFPQRSEEIRVLKAALKQNPKDGHAAYLLGCVLYDKRLYKEAAALWEDAISYLPKFYIPYRNLALAYFNHLDRAADALPLMCKAIELHPQDETLLSEIAVVMDKLGTPGAERAAFLSSHKPDVVSDPIQLNIAWAYNAASDYDAAESIMRSHNFYPGEGAEFITAEPYMFACFARGRIAYKEGRYEDALRDFRASQQMPENLHVGFWNESVTIPYRYYEAAALKALHRTEEADAIIAKLAGMKDTGMWNMGGEFLYYSAMSIRLAGDEMRAQRILRDAILAWEQELEDGCQYYLPIVGNFDCFIGNGPDTRRAALLGMLGYGALYNGNIAEAVRLFTDSLRLSPSTKIALELQLLQ